MNKGEYGITLYFNLVEDVSADTLSVVLKDPSGNEATKTATLGTSTISTDIGTLTANEYCTYTLADGDIDEAGRWMVRAVSDTGSIVRKTNWVPLVVKS